MAVFRTPLKNVAPCDVHPREMREFTVFPPAHHLRPVETKTDAMLFCDVLRQLFDANNREVNLCAQPSPITVTDDIEVLVPPYPGAVTALTVKTYYPPGAGTGLSMSLVRASTNAVVNASSIFRRYYDSNLNTHINTTTAGPVSNIAVPGAPTATHQVQVFEFNEVFNDDDRLYFRIDSLPTWGAYTGFCPPAGPCCSGNLLPVIQFHFTVRSHV